MTGPGLVMAEDQAPPKPWCARLGSSDELLDLTATGPDVWTGTSPDYPWGWVYGGRIAAQALRSASLSSPAGFAPSTLNCTFLSPARCDLPRTHHVGRLADTRRHAVRSVVVSQAGATVAHVVATLDSPPGSGDDSLGDVERIPKEVMEAARRRRFRGPAFDIGLFGRRLLDAGPDHMAAVITLDRPPASLSEAACLIAYAADDLPSDAARAMFGGESYLEGPGTSLWSLTGAYAIHFGTHPAGRELLFDVRTRGVLGSRASVEGSVIDMASGRVVAHCLQQVFIRKRKKPGDRQRPDRAEEEKKHDH